MDGAAAEHQAKSLTILVVMRYLVATSDARLQVMTSCVSDVEEVPWQLGATKGRHTKSKLSKLEITIEQRPLRENMCDPC